MFDEAMILEARAGVGWMRFSPEKAKVMTKSRDRET